MACNLQKNSLSVKNFALRRFVKRPLGLDGTQKFDGLTRTHTSVFLVMIDLCQENLDGIYYSHESIAKKAQCGRRTVVDALKRLQKKGYIDWCSRGTRLDPKTKKPRNLPNLYWLTEKLLHAVPFDVLTGELRDVDAEERIQPVLEKSFGVQKEHRILREELRSNSTLAPADAGFQSASPKGVPVGREGDGSGLDYSQSIIETKTLKPIPSGRSREATANDSPQKKQVPIQPLLRDQSIQVLRAYRNALAQKSYPEDNMFFTHQYPQMGVLIEMTGGYANAVRYVEYCVENWKDLMGSTGPSDTARLPSKPNLDKMLAHWRIKTWWARCRGVQTDQGAKRRQKAIEARAKFKREKENFKTMVSNFRSMATGEKPFDASCFDFAVHVPAKPAVQDLGVFAMWEKNKITI